MQPQPRRWMKYVLWSAAIYNITWGAIAVLFPSLAFHLAGMQPPKYPELWQCIGMIIGVYGIGFAAAAFDPLRHWPVVLTGLLGKVFGPIGFASAALRGRMPWRLGWTLVTNDLIWWIPFGLILLAAYRAALDIRRVTSPDIQQMALRTRTGGGETLLEMSNSTPLLLVFLRHAGCPFCRETLADIGAQREALESNGTRIVLIHMIGEADAASFLHKYGLQDIARVSDTGRVLYRAFGLSRGGLFKLFGPKVWWRAFQAILLNGHGIGGLAGDIFQMPGLFLVFRGEVLRTYLPQSVSDRPDYGLLVSSSY